jgi:hypothetical protein
LGKKQLVYDNRTFQIHPVIEDLRVQPHLYPCKQTNI